ncbi:MULTISPECIES: MocR-like pyridoxine biosynthesis transcription factor PdxR [Burkholderia]|jgi:GntR family transcriptional regulator/MocR family aminotransferase|uniref:PLP-dependent aminotransferase family protein n=2 Tax=Burkholderia contaminans TaxID=488447 RepID=A0A1E3FMR4_9BURK|nr:MULTISPECIES: PLP-dependent aminotransferase family protein [Burkholderia]UTP24441.1 PLP-dependent aminotransferase family protein [Burkholderia sp. FXe9]KKL32019.1 DNA-binding protein [Burkholderia contaminans LMG 23361]MBA9831929.1 PLP-dependent aminotransferase family protein [Burkholderia contaminans]MBA9838694.1 PLP-dependent aminotransferase family protein [Burkholderia contaminans]MBA9863910.1 PLP-dependent aminotransferase family protein [Burkholderia contaminans]
MKFDDLMPDRHLDMPVYRQLVRRFRDAIETGKLAPGKRVPSVRSLASELNLARGTVEAAYQILIGEGYLVARGPAGTVVSPQLPNGRQPRAAAPRPDEPPRGDSAASGPKPFQMGIPALDAFPRMPWIRLTGRHVRAMATPSLDYAPPQGHDGLRRALSAYLGVSRGIDCSAGQIFITAGYRGALDLICRTLLRAGDTGWFEDPGYIHARRVLEHAGMRLVPVPVDDDGLCVEAGLRRAADARFAVVTPTHQSPLGVALSLPRRLALLDWARQQRAWIVEDDYDSEFRYDGRPLPALKSLDRHHRVLYTGSFSKVLYPGLRLGYLVVPDEQVAAFRDTAGWLGGSGQMLMQSVVADFMEQGHFARHLKKMRALYATRRAWLIDALGKVFGDALDIPPRAGGLHVVAYWRTAVDDRAVARMANLQGFSIQPLNDWSPGGRMPPGMLLGFTNLTSAQQALTLVRRLYRLVCG